MLDAKDALLYVLGSEEFYNFYQRYIAPPPASRKQWQQSDSDTPDLLESYLQKIKTPECYVAILGTQGSGKSSLLNALLFGDQVLPVEVEETTCIPTLIRRVYAGEQRGAEIHYQDGHSENMPLTCEFLEKVVDNRYNPSNLMQVAYVVCRHNSPLLQEGFVFVDLPGVGSLTEKNEQATINFLRQTNVGIFMLRTVPPITNSEAGFIRVAWPMVQQSVFVQNLWARETEKELDEGMEHNEKVLQTIAEEKQTKPPKEIIAVNIAMACEGIFKNQSDFIAQSGIDNLRETLRRYAQHSVLQIFYYQTAQYFARLLKRAQDRIEERLALLRSDQEELLRKFEAEKAKYTQNKEALENRVKAHLDDFMGCLSTLKSDWLPTHLEKIGQTVHDRIDKMPLADMQEEDFRQTVRQTCAESFGIAYKDLQAGLARAAEDYILNLSSTLQQMASLDDVLSQNTYSPKAKDPKAAKGWSVVLTGGIAPLLIAGPVGWGIFGGAVLAGGLVRWLSGATAHKRIMRGLIKIIGDTRMQMRKELVIEVDNFGEKVATAIRSTVQTELAAYESELQRIEEDLREQMSDKKTKKESLEADLKQGDVFFKGLGLVITQQ
jgi:hypothetical protein